MPSEQPTPQQAPGEDTAVQAQTPPAYEPREADTDAYAQSAYEPDTWLADEQDELPHRPRRRLLGAGANPLAVALVCVLLCACGFIGGVLVEKGQTSSGPSSSAGGAAASFASRFAGLRDAGASGGGARTGSSGGVSGGLGGLFGASGARPTAGTVAYLEGANLYVTNAEGNTVKVTTSAATSVSKTVKSSVADVHPGETVTVTGASGANGVVSAESISVGSGAGGGGLAALFGSAGADRGSAGGGASREPSLFGNGG